MINNWQAKKLGEVCNIELGKTPSRANKQYWDSERQTQNTWLSIADLLNTEGNIISDSKEYVSDKGAKLLKTVKKGTLLVSFKLTLGRLAIAGKDLFTNEAIAALTLKNTNEISRDYLYHYLTHFDWDGEVKGDVKIKGKTLNKAKLKEIKILYPSLLEQLRIVKFLDEVFEATAKAKVNAEKNLQNAKELFESYLQSVFAPPSLKLRTGKESLGKDWGEKTLDEISLEFGRGKSKHRPRNDKKLYGGKYPFIQTGDIRNADHFITKFTQTYNGTGLAQSKLWPKGTICITIAANIAETGVIDFDACFPDSVIGLVVNPKVADTNFVEYLLQSFKTILQAKGKGSAQANINMATFEHERFPFPSLAEQKSIVAKLDALSAETKKLEAIYKQKLAALEELKKSVLRKAFAGEL